MRFVRFRTSCCGRPAYRQYLKLAQGPSTTHNRRMNRKEVREEAVKKRKYEEQLMRLPNVTSVGIGEKAGKLVITVFVTHKVTESALQLQEVVPKTLEW